ncbi:MAG: hypothetical protein WC966_00915 [Bradymonadales bacterium]|jgi:hypothetical protein
MDEILCQRLLELVERLEPRSYAMLRRVGRRWRAQIAAEFCDEEVRPIDETYLILGYGAGRVSCKLTGSDWQQLSARVEQLFSAAKVVDAWGMRDLAGDVGKSFATYPEHGLIGEAFWKLPSEERCAAFKDFTRRAQSQHAELKLKFDCLAHEFVERIYHKPDSFEERHLSYSASRASMLYGQSALTMIPRVNFGEAEAIVAPNFGVLNGYIESVLNSAKSALERKGFGIITGSWASSVLLSESLNAGAHDFSLPRNFQLKSFDKGVENSENLQHSRYIVLQSANAAVDLKALFSQLPSNVLYVDAPSEILRIDDDILELRFAMAYFVDAAGQMLALPPQTLRFRLSKLWEKLYLASDEGQELMGIQCASHAWEMPYKLVQSPSLYFNSIIEKAQFLR